ncbi:MAG: thioredoxin-disulfide reductase [Candidatus Hinthialibacter antarcticus]|nr:thioredoxin-disulfide reductase [Candidatus Hinthialibacter antarcticus]
MDQTKWDTIIVGAGPAGMAAALYTSRGNLSTLVIEKGPTGGQIATTEAVENYPGFPEPETGPGLSDRFQKQAEKFGAVIKNGTVTEIRKNDDETFTVVMDGRHDLTAITVICAMGADPRKLGVPGEEKNVGTGVSYCATCDGAFFREKKVVVVGGGDAAVEEGLFLTRYASSVTIIHRRDELRATKVLQERAFDNDKIDFIWDSAVEEIVSEGVVKSVKLRNLKTDETSDFETQGVFIFVGHVPNTTLVKDMLKMDEHNLIDVDLWMKTSMTGIYACGDCRTEAARQLASSAGDGVTAAIAATKHVDEFKIAHKKTTAAN